MESKLLMKNWKLPECVTQQYAQSGLTSMFKWQADCLSIEGVLEGRNLVYAAPTSAGKTLVVEILLLKRVLETGKKALFILPFISVAREKLFHLRQLFEETGIRVDGYMGGHAPTNGISSVDIAICTIEKANGLINRLIEERSIGQIGMLVVDELHMVGDEGRGYILELLLTKIRFMAQNQDIDKEPTEIQIVGMSATLPNLDLLADWLNAALYVTDFRPVPLQRCMKIGTALFDERLTKMRDFESTINCKGDEDHVAALCFETLCDGNSVLIFCPTKNWCEKLADNVAHQFYDLNSAHQKDQNLPSVQLKTEEIKEVFEQLSQSPAGVDAILNRTVSLGVAYHHAGLTTEERDIIEAGFRNGAIRVLVATSTLSSGVNLPARRVIIRSPTFNRKTLDVRTYRQMSGRAGRKGVDDEGESILICHQNEQSRGRALMTAQPQPIKSCLIKANEEELTTSMKRAILEIIVNGIASTYGSLQAYIDCTLLASQLRTQKAETKGPMTRRRSSLSPKKTDPGVGPAVIENCIQWLVEHEFIHVQDEQTSDDSIGEMQRNKRHIMATQLGRAALLSSLPTSEALTVLADLHQAMKSLALDTELHLIYLVTPIFCYNEWTGLDWYQYLNVYESLSSSYKNAGNLIGISEQFLVQMASGAPMGSKRGRQTERMQRLLGTHRRFYAALALHDLVQEVPLAKVSSKYSCNRGMLQQLQQSAASFAGMVTTFCQELGWWSLEVLLREFQARLAFGVQRELMDLMQISLLNSQRARALYSAGLISCQLVGNSKPVHIEAILRNSSHFQTTRKTANEAEWEVEERRKRKNIFFTGRRGLTEQEAATLIIEEARKIYGHTDIETQINSSFIVKPNDSVENTHLPEEHLCEEVCPEDEALGVMSHPSSNKKRGEEDSGNSEVCESIATKSPFQLSGKEEDFKKPCRNEQEEIGCKSQKSSLTETQLKQMLQDDSSELIFSGDEGDRSSSYDENNKKQKSPKVHNVEDQDEDSHVLDSGSDTNAPITLRFDSDSLDELMDLVSEDDSDHTEESSIPTFSSAEVKSSEVCVLVKKVLENPEKIHNGTELEETESKALKSKTFKEKQIISYPENRTVAFVNKNSLTESQLDDLLDESFTQDGDKIINKDPAVENDKGDSSVNVNDREKKTIICDSTTGRFDSPCPKIGSSQIRLSGTPSFSPATIKAMDMSFSPCMFENSGQEDQVDGNWSSVQKIGVVLGKENVSTPKNIIKNALSGKLSSVFGSSMQTVESPLLHSAQPTPNIEDCGHDKNASIKEATTPLGSVDSSLDDLFESSNNPDSREAAPTSCHDSTGFSTESLGELDCALNLSLPSSNFSIDSSVAGGSIDDLNVESRKRKSPEACEDSLGEKVQKWTDDVAVLQTPPKIMRFEDLEDQLILSSQKEDHKKSMKRSLHSSNKGKKEKNLDVNERKKNGPSSDMICFPELLKDVTNIREEEESIITSSQPLLSLAYPASQKVSVSQSGLTIIDVCSHNELFESFLKEWTSKDHFSFAVTTRSAHCRPVGRIGPSVENAESESLENGENGSSGEAKVLYGMAVCWGQQDAYYVSLEKVHNNRRLNDTAYETIEEFMNLKPVETAETLPPKMCVNLLKSASNTFSKKPCSVVACDAKKQFKLLHVLLGIMLDVQWQDPLVASWMLDPSENGRTLIRLVNQHIPEDMHLLTGLNKCNNYGSISCSGRNESHAPGRIRACAEAVCSYRLMKKLRNELCHVKMWNTFCSVEMPHLLSLSFIELNGIGFDSDTCGRHLQEMHEMMRHLEKKAHKLAKKKFTLSSPNEVAKVLFGDLGLPPDGIEKCSLAAVDLRRVGRPGTWRKGYRKGGKIPSNWCTKKEILGKLAHLHPLPGIITSWRQINNTLSKVIHPFIRCYRHCDESKMSRIRSEYLTHTVTGRVSVAEPNIQNVPKAFHVKLVTDREKSENGVRICPRDLFIPAKGHVLIAADYSQLELRIFAHLSEDEKLLSVLNRDAGDVFKVIAAQWRGTPVDDVTEVERQQAKKICYGMLYGIGARALSEQLDVDEKSAEEFMESFMRSYPSVRSYIRKLVRRCSETGYVETLLGRRRFLPSITDPNMSVRSQAERQAVNTTVQGSAADIVKKATVKLQCQVEKKWSVLLGKKLSQKKSATGRTSSNPGCYLVLHLHDELMFEVREDILNQVAPLVRKCMEQAVQLRVKLPVKLSVGDSWGGLRDYSPK